MTLLLLLMHLDLGMNLVLCCMCLLWLSMCSSCSRCRLWSCSHLENTSPALVKQMVLMLSFIVLMQLSIDISRPIRVIRKVRPNAQVSSAYVLVADALLHVSCVVGVQHYFFLVVQLFLFLRRWRWQRQWILYLAWDRYICICALFLVSQERSVVLHVVSSAVVRLKFDHLLALALTIGVTVFFHWGLVNVVSLLLFFCLVRFSMGVLSAWLHPWSYFRFNFSKVWKHIHLISGEARQLLMRDCLSVFNCIFCNETVSQRRSACPLLRECSVSKGCSWWKSFELLSLQLVVMAFKSIELLL